MPFHMWTPERETQSSVKRMLAYSSIADGARLVLALLAVNDLGNGAVLFYLSRHFC